MEQNFSSSFLYDVPIGNKIKIGRYVEEKAWEFKKKMGRNYGWMAVIAGC